MKGWVVGNNILEYLFISYPCFNTNCPGMIALSLDNLYMNTRTRCPVCKRECSFYMNKGNLASVQKSFDLLYRQLYNRRLSPIVFSREVAPKTVFVNPNEEDNTNFPSE